MEKHRSIFKVGDKVRFLDMDWYHFGGKKPAEFGYVTKVENYIISKNCHRIVVRYFDITDYPGSYAVLETEVSMFADEEPEESEESPEYSLTF